MADKPAGKEFGGRTLKEKLSTREGAIVLALVAAALAGLLLFVFAKQYKDNVERDNATRSVFVARALIPKGTTAASIASQRLLQRTGLKPKDVLPGAIIDPAAIAGQSAVADIAPGQQVTTPAFAPTGEGIPSTLTGHQRAIAIPVDGTRSVDGQVHAGDHVDVLLGQTGSLRTLMQDVYVIGGSATVNGGAGNIVFRGTESQVARLAFASDNGKIWLSLRPVVGATDNAPTSVTNGSLFNGGR